MNAPVHLQLHCSAWLQARISAVNTALTALGMYFLKIPGVGLLSLFVFICSFIPIAGVFISTTPIAFVALTEYGFLKVGPGADQKTSRPCSTGVLPVWPASMGCAHTIVWRPFLAQCKCLLCRISGLASNFVHAPDTEVAPACSWVLWLPW